MEKFKPIKWVNGITYYSGHEFRLNDKMCTLVSVGFVTNGIMPCVLRVVDWMGKTHEIWRGRDGLFVGLSFRNYSPEKIAGDLFK